jgi:hypothetical protein
MHNPILIKNLIASAIIAAFRIVRGVTDEQHVTTAIDSQAPMLGVSNALGVEAIGDRVDVITHGFADVEYGGAVSIGDPLTADAQGRAVKATFVGEQVVYIVGYAATDGVLGDIGSMRIAPSALANESQVVLVEGELSSAEILALNATPIQALAAPGANRAIVPLRGEAYLDYNSAAYDGIAAGEDLVLRYTDGSGAIALTFEATGFLDQTADQVRMAFVPSSANLTPVADAALVWHMSAGEIATGDSPVRWRVWYMVVDTAWGGA